MNSKEKIETLNQHFMLLSEENKQYVLAIVDALAYASMFAKEPDPLINTKKVETV